MEPMEFDSEGSPQRGRVSATVSPMQHSGWEEKEEEETGTTKTSYSQHQNKPDKRNASSQLLWSPWASCQNVISSVTSLRYQTQQNDSFNFSEKSGERDFQPVKSSDVKEFSARSKWKTYNSVVSAVTAFTSTKKCNDDVEKTPATAEQSVVMSRTFPKEYILTKSLYPNMTSVLANNKISCSSTEYHLPSISSSKDHLLKKRRKISPEDSVRDSPIRKLSKQTVAKKQKKSVKISSDKSQGSGVQRCCTRILLLFIVPFLLLTALNYYYTLSNTNCSTYLDIDFTKLQSVIQSQLYGQHIASKIISEHLENYLSQFSHSQTSLKPLVLSLHGWTGVGKNYITWLISDFLPVTNVKKFLIALHFTHKSKSDVYSEQTFQWVVTNVTQCKINIFIFDEMDKAPEGVVSGLTSALSHLTETDKKQAPVIIFLLSNSKGTEITRKVLSSSTPKERELYSFEDFKDIFTQDKHDWFSKMLSRHVISAVAPFLPLERSHVTKCIKRDILLKGFEVTDKLVDSVLKEMSFFQVASGQSYSHSGCKRVSEKVDLVYS